MKHTAQMSPRELAKAFAEVRGYKGREGGWIYSENGTPVAHGWDTFAEILAARRWIVEGKGIDWRASEGKTLGRQSHTAEGRMILTRATVGAL